MHVTIHWFMSFRWLILLLLHKYNYAKRPAIVSCLPSLPHTPLDPCAAPSARFHRWNNCLNSCHHEIQWRHALFFIMFSKISTRPFNPCSKNYWDNVFRRTSSIVIHKRTSLNTSLARCKWAHITGPWWMRGGRYKLKAIRPLTTTLDKVHSLIFTITS